MRRALTAFIIIFSTSALADPPEITGVSVQQSGNAWRFDVTLTHPDTGWDHYADSWRVLSMDGQELGLRNLVHPHVDEQPFTRSLGGVQVPDGATQVRVQARCSVDGWAEMKTTISLK
jgi:hypothetical protein